MRPLLPLLTASLLPPSLALLVRPGAPPPPLAPAYLPVPTVLGVPLNVTVDWFSGSRHLFEALLLRPLERAGGGALPPGLTFLEVGSLEGLSARWLGDMIVARSAGGVLHCVDSFGGGAEHTSEAWFASGRLGAIEARFDENVAALAAAGIVVKHRGLSRIELARLLAEGREGSFDFAYIDGSHAAGDVIGDAVAAFWLAKPGSGIIAFDDYAWNLRSSGGEDPLQLPGPALDAFLSLFADRLEVLHKYYQLWVRRIS